MAGIVLVALCDLGGATIGIGQVVKPEAILHLEDGKQLSIWTFFQSLLILIRFSFLIIAAILFLIWLNYSHKNLLALRPTHLEFSSGWAVGWWFIPFANLVKPFQVVREVWWESDPVVNDNPKFLTASLHSAPRYMALWWAFWIIMNLLKNIASRTVEFNDISSIQLSGYIFIASGIAAVVAASLAIFVVFDITRRQELRYANLRLQDGTFPSPTPLISGTT